MAYSDSYSLYGPVAQLGEHLPCKQEVRGSSPFEPTTASAARHAQQAEKAEATV